MQDGKVRGWHSVTHHMTGSKEYNSWRAMVERCTNPKNSTYAYYGGKGIEVCEAWRKFDGFFADMGLAPTPAHTIDRVDTAQGYYAGNCRWATRKEQSFNRACTVKIEFDGVVYSASELAQLLGMSLVTLIRRHKRGDTGDRLTRKGRNNYER